MTIFTFAAVIPAAFFRLSGHSADMMLTWVCGKKWGAFDDFTVSICLEAYFFLKFADRCWLRRLALVDKTSNAIVSAPIVAAKP